MLGSALAVANSASLTFPAFKRDIVSSFSGASSSGLAFIPMKLAIPFSFFDNLVVPSPVAVITAVSSGTPSFISFSATNASAVLAAFFSALFSLALAFLATLCLS